MEASAWNNGGSTYGIRVGTANRDVHFDRRWTHVELEIEGSWQTLPLSDGFWHKCPEFRSPIIREWLARNGLLQWPRGNPPKFRLIPLDGNRFRLVR